MYTKEQLMPKRYPEEKPNIDSKYWKWNGSKYWKWNGSKYGVWLVFNWNESEFWKWDELVRWFIDIPGPPVEVKPLAYPENKPSEEGEYIVHNKLTDRWLLRWSYPKYVWDEIDWFIPYNLDKQESEEKVSDEWTYQKGIENLMRTDVKKIDIHYGVGGETLNLACGKEYIIKRVAEVLGCNVTVTRKEPEIAPCPVCEYDTEIEWGHAACFAACAHCGIMQSEAYETERECIKAWNALPRKADHAPQ